MQNDRIDTMIKNTDMVAATCVNRTCPYFAINKRKIHDPATVATTVVATISATLQRRLRCVHPLPVYYIDLYPPFTG